MREKLLEEIFIAVEKNKRVARRAKSKGSIGLGNGNGL